MAKAMSSPVMSSTLHESSQMVSVMAASSDAGAVADAGVAVDAEAAAGVGVAVDAEAAAGVGVAVDAGAVAGAGVAVDAGVVAGAGIAVDAGAAGIHAGCSGWFSAKLSPRIARTQLAAGKSLVPMP